MFFLDNFFIKMFFLDIFFSCLISGEVSVSHLSGFAERITRQRSRWTTSAQLSKADCQPLTSLFTRGCSLVESGRFGMYKSCLCDTECWIRICSFYQIVQVTWYSFQDVFVDLWLIKFSCQQLETTGLWEQNRISQEILYKERNREWNY